MAEILVLDAGPVGLACGNPSRSDVRRFRFWMELSRARGAWLVVPDIVDYEVRRGLIAEGDRRRRDLDRLDALYRVVTRIPITSEALRRAAELWGWARLAGRTVADPKALGGEAILSAQALGFAGANDTLTVVTDDVGDLSRFVSALRWEAIGF